MKRDDMLFLSSLKHIRSKINLLYIVLDISLSIIIAILSGNPFLILVIPFIIWFIVIIYRARRILWEYLSNKIIETDFEYKLVGNSMIDLNYPPPNCYENDAIDFLKRVAGDDSVEPAARMDALCRIAVDTYLSEYCRFSDSHNYQKMTQKAISYLHNHYRIPNTPIRNEWI